jgi:diadenosine tetraphosphate (Ap4A) HIT family hydrolase
MKQKTNNCNVCIWLEELRSQGSQFLIKEFKTGFAVISKYQYEFYRGYSLFLYKHHKTELHELESDERRTFLEEMSQLAGAIHKTVNPDKMNYELLGNGEPHMHWHLIPRFKTDPEFSRAIWLVDKSVRQAADTYPSSDTVAELRTKILTQLGN